MFNFFLLLIICNLDLRNGLKAWINFTIGLLFKFFNYNIKCVSNNWFSSHMTLFFAGIWYKRSDSSMRTEGEGVLSEAVSVSDSLILCQRNQLNIRLCCLHRLFVGAYKISKLSFIGQYCSIDSGHDESLCLRKDLVFFGSVGFRFWAKYIYCIFSLKKHISLTHITSIRELFSLCCEQTWIC